MPFSILIEIIVIIFFRDKTSVNCMLNNNKNKATIVNQNLRSMKSFGLLKY